MPHNPNPESHMPIAVIIPCRLASTRFPKKVLSVIGGKTLLEHVVHRAQEALRGMIGVSLYVACDDATVASLCHDIGVASIMTPPDLDSGTDRVYAAASLLSPTPDAIINLQGDAPLIPIDAIRGLITRLSENRSEYTTVVQPLTWNALDKFKEHKNASLTSGTTAIVVGSRALWFSKQIIPYMRHHEKDLHTLSAVNRHLGIYGYSYDFLKKFVSWPVGKYEKIEGLEQLRAIENGYYPDVYTLDPSYDETYISIDTPEDARLFEAYLSGKS